MPTPLTLALRNADRLYGQPHPPADSVLLDLDGYRVLVPRNVLGQAVELAAYEDASADAMDLMLDTLGAVALDWETGDYSSHDPDDLAREVGRRANVLIDAREAQ